MDTIKLLIVALGCLLIAVGAGLVYLPAGVIVGGVAAVTIGALLEAAPSAGEK